MGDPEKAEAALVWGNSAVELPIARAAATNIVERERERERERAEREKRRPEGARRGAP